MTDAVVPDGGAEGPACHACGDRIEETDTRRVATRVEEGRAVYVHFCDDDCLEEWRSSEGFEEWRTAG